jgi:heat shock protein HslJ
MTRRLLAAIAAGLLLVACDWLPFGDRPDIEGAWELTQGTYDGEPIVLPEGSRITLTIEGDELGGTSACNQYGGTYELDGWSITIGALSMTEMACDEPIMAAEAAFLAALADVDTVEPSRSLWLTGPSSDLQFGIVPPVDDAAIVGTVWILDSIITGDAVSSVMGEPATLELADDGTLAGSTGCRAFSGTYAITGDEVQVTQLVTDDRACPDELAGQDDHVLDVLGDGFTAAVDGARLTLMDGTNGLGYTAEP